MRFRPFEGVDGRESDDPRMDTRTAVNVNRCGGPEGAELQYSKYPRGYQPDGGDMDGGDMDGGDMDGGDMDGGDMDGGDMDGGDMDGGDMAGVGPRRVRPGCSSPTGTAPRRVGGWPGVPPIGQAAAALSSDLHERRGHRFMPCPHARR